MEFPDLQAPGRKPDLSTHRHDQALGRAEGMDERFSEPEPNVIESSAGFSVRVLGQTGMRYTEGCRSVEIDSATKPEVAMFIGSIRVWKDVGLPGTGYRF